MNSKVAEALMKKTTSLVLVFVVINAVTIACSSLAKKPAKTDYQWDFDHNVQFKQTQLNHHNFQLEVIANNTVKFNHLSAFLLRRSYVICGEYGYKLKMIKGVESIDYQRASPNLIKSNLVARLECPTSDLAK